MMYEENAKPLPPGDIMHVFADELRAVAEHGQPPLPLSPDNVVQLANRAMQPHFAAVCRKLLLPGSKTVGAESLAELGVRAAEGKSCLLCMSHLSNLDVPTLYTLLQGHAAAQVFDRIIWIAGRKLSEDDSLTQTLIQAFNRIVVTPPSWFARPHSRRELNDAQRINRAAQREMMQRRQQGWIFGLFPAATRLRPDDESTAHAIPETDTYVKTFDYLILGNIQGCTLPVSCDHHYTHETPRRDRVVYRFGPVLDAPAWRADAQARFPTLDQRHATAHAMDEDIAQLVRV